MEISQLAPNLFVGAQIAPKDLKYLANDGFTEIVCNRPDAEHPEDPGSAEMAGLTANLGMTFHYLPIKHGEAFETQAKRLADLASSPDAKVFAYCRSGARSSNAWALAQTLQSGRRQTIS